MKNEIKFSVIIPTFNRAILLEKAIVSVLKQEYKNFEIIVIDNFSSDHTEQLIKKYIYKYKFIKYCKFANQNIIASSRNFGAKIPSGDYLCFLDSDDYWNKNKLRIIYNKILKKNFDIIHHDMKYVNRKKTFNFKRKIKSYKYHSKNWSKLIINGNRITTSSVIVNKETFERLDGFNINKNLVSCEDLDLWIRIFKNNGNSLYIKKNLGTYVSHENNFSINNSYKPFLAICKKYRDDFNNNQRNVLYARRIYIGKLFKLKKFLIYALQYGEFEIKYKLLLKYLFFVCFKIA